MKKKEIQKKYNDKIKLIKKYNISYYDKNNPIVNDQVYDNLKKEILQLEIDYSFLQSEDFDPSPTIHFPQFNNNLFAPSLLILNPAALNDFIRPGNLL